MSTSHQKADPIKLNQKLASLSLTLCHARKLIDDAHQLSCEMHPLDDEKTASHAADKPSHPSASSDADADDDVQAQATIAQRELMVVLRLVSYAADAMRVLDRLQWHADRSGAFDRTLRTVCPDWRNPGCIDDPADLIALALAQTTQVMTKAQKA